MKSYRKDKWDKAYHKNEQSATYLQNIKLHKKEWLEEMWDFGRFILKDIENWTKLDKNSKILDLGCGSNGVFLIPAARMGIKSFGVDISSCALKKLKERVNSYGLKNRIRLHEGDIEEGSFFKDNTFDAVLSSGTICHIKNIRGIMSELLRITKNSGIIFLNGFLNKYHPSYLPSHIINEIKKKIGANEVFCYFHTFTEIKDMLSFNNLKIVKIKENFQFRPFSGTFIYPNYFTSIFNFINDKVLYSIPSEWGVYVQKVKTSGNQGIFIKYDRY